MVNPRLCESARPLFKNSNIESEFETLPVKYASPRLKKLLSRSKRWKYFEFMVRKRRVTKPANVPYTQMTIWVSYVNRSLSQISFFSQEYKHSKFFISYKRGKSLKDVLVKSKLKAKNTHLRATGVVQACNNFFIYKNSENSRLQDC